MEREREIDMGGGEREIMVEGNCVQKKREKRVFSTYCTASFIAPTPLSHLSSLSLLLFFFSLTHTLYYSLFICFSLSLLILLYIPYLPLLLFRLKSTNLLEWKVSYLSIFIVPDKKLKYGWGDIVLWREWSLDIVEFMSQTWISKNTKKINFRIIYWDATTYTYLLFN